MKTETRFCRFALSVCAMLLVVCVGCDKKQANKVIESAGDAVQDAEAATEDAAGAVAESVGDAAEKGGEMASELGDKAMAFVSPLKEKFGSLDSLKDKPEELKNAVTELIQSIEEKAEDVELPEAMSTALASVKEKLVALKEYLEGEVDQAKIDEHLKDIGDSIKSGLGL